MTVDVCPIEKLTFYAGSHAYYVKMKGEKAGRWSGASAYGKIIEKTDNLTRWKVVSALTGANADPTLLRRFAHATTRNEQDNLIEALLDAAKANEGRDFGSDAHRITELYDQGKLPPGGDEFTATIVQRWTGAIDAANVRIDPLLVERVVLLPDLKVCATFDRIATYLDEAHVVDLKTGSSGTRYAHTMCVQLALIANAEWMASGPGETKGDATVWTEFVRPPAMNRERGLIVSMPKDEDITGVYALDLVAGWNAAQLAHTAKQWAASDPAAVISTFTFGGASNDAVHSVPSDAVADGPGVAGDGPVGVGTSVDDVHPVSDGGAAVDSARVDCAGDEVVSPLDELYAYTYARTKATFNHSDAAASLCVHMWPADVPTFGEARDLSHVFTEPQLDAILAVIVRVDAEHRVSFPDVDDPRKPDKPPLVIPEPATRPDLPPEGPKVGDDDLAAVKAAQETLTPAQFDALAAIVVEADAHGVGFKLGVCPSQRRWAIARMLLLGVRFEQPDLIEAAIAYALCTDVPFLRSRMTLGEWCGRLTVEQANDAHDALAALDAGTLVVSFDEFGEMPQLVQPAA